MFCAGIVLEESGRLTMADFVHRAAQRQSPSMVTWVQLTPASPQLRSLLAALSGLHSRLPCLHRQPGGNASHAADIAIEHFPEQADKLNKCSMGRRMPDTVPQYKAIGQYLFSAVYKVNVI